MDMVTRRSAMAAAVMMTLAPLALRAQPAPLPDKPFAEHRIVLQLSDNDPKKEGLVLSVANNLIKAYDPDKIAVEVVAFGPGIDLLRIENTNRARVESLIAHPATMTHVKMGAEARRVAGISGSLLRLSVGMEAEADLIAGLEAGFAAIKG